MVCPALAVRGEGLIAHYTFSEDSGTTAVDSSEFGNDGTIFGASYVSDSPSPPCARGTSLLFSGDRDQRVEIPDAASLRPALGLTVEAWVKLGDGTGNQVIVGKQLGLAGADSYVLLTAMGTREVAFGAHDGTQQVFAVGRRIVDDRWHHIAGLLRAGMLELYVDGVLDGCASFPNPIAYDSNPVSLGNDLNGDGWIESWSGAIYDVRIYDRGIPPDEDWDGVPNSCDETDCVPLEGIVSRWRGDQGAEDSVGSNHGTFLGGAVAGDPLGCVGGAFRLDGVDDFVRIPANPTLDTASFTMLGWFRQESAGPYSLFEYHTGGDAADFGPHVFSQAASELFANVVDADVQYHILSSVPGLITLNEWHFYALTYDHATGVGTLYLDGSIVDQKAFPSLVPRTQLDVYLGHRPGERFFDGLIDDVQFFSRPLSTSEIQGLYKCRLPFLRGDSNSSRVVDISDSIFTLGYLFLGSESPSCMAAADSNDDGTVDISDPTYSLNFLFLGGPPLHAPFPDIGSDPTPDALTCRLHSRCP